MKGQQSFLVVGQNDPPLTQGRPVLGPGYAAVSLLPSCGAVQVKSLATKAPVYRPDLMALWTRSGPYAIGVAPCFVVSYVISGLSRVQTRIFIFFSLN